MRLSLLGLTSVLALGILTQEVPAVAPAESKSGTAAKKGPSTPGGKDDSLTRRTSGVRMPVARYERDPFHTYRTRYWRFYGPTSRAAEHYSPSPLRGGYSSDYRRRYSSSPSHDGYSSRYYRGDSYPSYRAREPYSTRGR